VNEKQARTVQKLMEQGVSVKVATQLVLNAKEEHKDWWHRWQPMQVATRGWWK